MPANGRESEWDDEQRALMVASFEVEAETPDHGFHLSEALSDEADPNKPGGSFKFVAGNPVTDFAEKARRDAEQAYFEHYKDANRNGLIFPVRKVDRT